MNDTLTDAWTVTQKEMRELLANRSSSPLSLLMISSVILFLGIILPLQAGPAWLDQPWLLSLWAWFPVLIVAMTVIDSVAGERERHTLETLLASRLSDRAILLGKVGAAVLYGWGIMLVTIIVSILAINIVYARDTLLLYRPLLLLGGGLLSLLASTLAASIAVLISLRTESVRRAQLTVLLLLILAVVLQFVGTPFVRDAAPESWHSFFLVTATLLERFEFFAVATIFLLVLNVALLALATSWFRRDRLNLH